MQKWGILKCKTTLSPQEQNEVVERLRILLAPTSVWCPEIIMPKDGGLTELPMFPSFIFISHPTKQIEAVIQKELGEECRFVQHDDKYTTVNEEEALLIMEREHQMTAGAGRFMDLVEGATAVIVQGVFKGLHCIVGKREACGRYTLRLPLPVGTDLTISANRNELKLVSEFCN